jgi:ribosomal protein S27AE
MRIVRDGKSIVGVILPGAKDAVVCGKCGLLFRSNHILSDTPRKSCPACGEHGPFRKSNETDIAAYFEKRRIRPIHYLQAVGLMLIVGAIVALITWVLG